jgi:hypothetical protein
MRRSDDEAFGGREMNDEDFKVRTLNAIKMEKMGFKVQWENIWKEDGLDKSIVDELFQKDEEVGR